LVPHTGFAALVRLAPTEHDCPGGIQRSPFPSDRLQGTERVRTSEPPHPDRAWGRSWAWDNSTTSPVTR